MLKMGEINPLNVFNLRKLLHCPPHFTKVFVDVGTFRDSKTVDKQIADWIVENLSGRFYVGSVYTKDSDQKISLQKCIAFEIPSEASFFSLVSDRLF